MGTTEHACDKCNGQGYLTTETGNQPCTCTILTELKSHLKKAPAVALALKSKVSVSMLHKQMILSTTSVSTGMSVLKSFYIYASLKGILNDSSKTIDIVDTDTMLEAHFGNSEVYTMSSIKEASFLVILIKPSSHKSLSGALESIVQYRKTTIDRPTWLIYISKKGVKLSEDKHLENLTTLLKEYKYKPLRVKS